MNYKEAMDLAVEYLKKAENTNFDTTARANFARIAEAYTNYAKELREARKI